MLRRKDSRPQAIREAIDFYPGGLCFSMPDGRPILVNRQMNALVSRLTGHTVLDADAVWRELCALPAKDGCAPMERPWAESGDPGTLVFSFPDGRIWQFRRETLAEADAAYIQLEAAEITDLYRLSEQLHENNERLKGLQARQKSLLANIVQINREKELLAVKMRVHDELGRSLIATEKALRGGTLSRDAAALTKGWEDAIRDLENIPLDETPADVPPEAELLQVADLIGCRIDFAGERPTDRGAHLLLCAAVREALTNAVRHAGANRLTVETTRAGALYRTRISDNGSARPAAVREGDGLRNLRKRLEQEGASLRIDCGSGGVVLTVVIPAAGEAPARKEAQS